MEIIHDHGYSFAESDDIVMSVFKIKALVIHLTKNTSKSLLSCDDFYNVKPF